MLLMSVQGRTGEEFETSYGTNDVERLEQYAKDHYGDIAEETELEHGIVPALTSMEKVKAKVFLTDDVLRLT